MGIQYTGLNVSYDGSTITEVGNPDSLSSLVFLVDDRLLGWCRYGGRRSGSSSQPLHHLLQGETAHDAGANKVEVDPVGHASYQGLEPVGVVPVGLQRCREGVSLVVVGVSEGPCRIQLGLDADV